MTTSLLFFFPAHFIRFLYHSVQVYVRRDALCRAVYTLPVQEWREEAGFTEDELEHIKRVIVKMTPLILEVSQTAECCNSVELSEKSKEMSLYEWTFRLIASILKRKLIFPFSRSAPYEIR